MRSAPANVTPGPTSVIVVIPTYNERENLSNLARAVLGLGSSYQLLIVDDNSPDRTGEIADDLAIEFPGRFDVLHRDAKAGLGRAYVAGLSHALGLGGTLVAQMDADHSHRPEDLARLVAELEGDPGAGLALGSRYVAGGETQGWPWHRKAISRAGGIYAGLILGVPIRDLTGGFKVWRRDALEAIELSSVHSDGYSFQIETTYRALENGIRVLQVPITFNDRVAGKSKLSQSVVIEAAIMPWRLRLRKLTRRPW